MAWTLLIVAGLLETVWALTMKLSHGFTKPSWAVATFAVAGVSFWLLAYAMRTLPAGTAYAVWTGIGAIGVAVAGVIIFKEPASLARIASIMLIVLGVIGLRLTGSGEL